MTDAVSSALQVYQSSAQFETLKLAFARECVERVRHLLEDDSVARCLDTLGAYINGQVDRGTLDLAASEAAATPYPAGPCRRQTTPPTRQFTAPAATAQSATPSHLSPRRPGNSRRWDTLRARS